MAQKQRELKAAVTTASNVARQAADAARDHKQGEAELADACRRATRALQELEDSKMRKMHLVASDRGNRAAAEAAEWMQTSAPPAVKEHAIGPLLMYIDVPDPSHQQMVEEAIGPKFAFSGFLAATDDARDAMVCHKADRTAGTLGTD